MSQTDISGNLKVSVKLVAGMIEGDGSLNLGESKESFASKTSFTIHGTLKKTIFATSFDGLVDLIDKIRENPDEYLSEVPQENYTILPFCYQLPNQLLVIKQSFILFFLSNPILLMEPWSLSMNFRRNNFKQFWTSKISTMICPRNVKSTNDQCTVKLHLTNMRFKCV